MLRIRLSSNQQTRQNRSDRFLFRNILKFGVSYDPSSSIITHAPTSYMVSVPLSRAFYVWRNTINAWYFYASRIEISLFFLIFLLSQHFQISQWLCFLYCNLTGNKWIVTVRERERRTKVRVGSLWPQVKERSSKRCR